MKNILVATDFSTRSDRALRRAVLIAARNKATLTLVHVVDDDQPTHLINRQKQAAQEILAQAAATITEFDYVTTGSVVTEGDAFAGILQTADQLKPDLIIVGPHRRQFLDTFTGTTAERTIRRSQRPVLMANAMPSAPYAHPLFAVDMDEASRTAANAALGFGLFSGTDAIALHLFDAPAVGMMQRAMEVPDAIDHYVDSVERRARAEVQSFLTTCGLERLPLLLRPLQGGAASGIRACADEQNADLIVMGTNQRKGFERFFLGSVAQAVLLDARQDVLIVPAENVT
jgi:nucleotide-binding universal stress UspA family protein